MKLFNESDYVWVFEQVLYGSFRALLFGINEGYIMVPSKGLKGTNFRGEMKDFSAPA